MEPGLFRYIWRYSARDQIALVMMSAVALPFLYFTFDLPKIIINQAIGGEGGFPKVVLGYEFPQIPYLLLLCGAFLTLVLINGALKYFSATYRYKVGDRLLRRLRYDLIERLMRFPVAKFRNTSSGQVVSMVTAETSNLGFFIAESFTVPAIAGGTLLTIVLFMFVQDWTMGVAAIALYPLQIYLIPRIQRRVNRLQRDEVLTIRRISERIGDVVAGAPEIHGHDTSQYELADFSHRLGVVFKLRVAIASNRYMANVLNTFFSQLTPFFFLSIGGYLVIIGDISLGALVAVLAAYKDMYTPWKDLIDYYQKCEDARVRYNQLGEYFQPSDLLDRSLLNAEPAISSLNATSLVASNVVVEAEEGVKPINAASLTLKLPIHAAIVGASGSGREEFAQLLSRQLTPQAGRVSIGDLDFPTLPDSVTGRRIGYVGPQTYLGSGTIRSALLYSLQRRPGTSPAGEHETAPGREAELVEASHVGNSTYDIFKDWLDYAAAGCVDRAALNRRSIEVLRLVDLEFDIYEIGLKRTFDPTLYPNQVGCFIRARDDFCQRLAEEGLTSLVEIFSVEAYNRNASVAENILFGTPVGPTFALDSLGENPYMLSVIAQVGLTDEFLEKGRRLAVIMTDIFRDMAEGHEFFERFSFIRAEDLALFESIIRRADTLGLEHLGTSDRAHLTALPFKLVAAQHHVGLIDRVFQERILAARRAFAEKLPDHLRPSVQFFDRTVYNAALNVAENVLMGKAAAAKAGAIERVGRLIDDAIDAQGLRSFVIELGMEFEIGIAGSRLTNSQRQKLALARCLLKRPDILILNEALAAMEPAAQVRIITALRGEMKDRSLLMFEATAARANQFERVLTVEQGKITDASVSGADTSAKPRAEGDSDHGQSLGDLNDLVSILIRVPLFAAIDRSNLKLLAFTSEYLTFEAGQYVFHQGDLGDRAYVIVEGEVDVILEAGGNGTQETEGGKIVATLAPHQVFGEMALLSKMPRTTAIRARGVLGVLAIRNDVFLALVEKNSEIATSVMRLLAGRLAATLRELANA